MNTCNIIKIYSLAAIAAQKYNKNVKVDKEINKCILLKLYMKALLYIEVLLLRIYGKIIKRYDEVG